MTIDDLQVGAKVMRRDDRRRGEIESRYAGGFSVKYVRQTPDAMISLIQTHNDADFADFIEIMPLSLLQFD